MVTATDPGAGLLTVVATFAGVLARIFTLAAVLPVLGHNAVPARIRVALAFGMSLLLLPILPVLPFGLVDEPIALAIALTREALVGLVLGIIARLAFDAVLFAGEASGMLMGLTIASIIDPALGERSSIIAQLMNGVAFALFLTLDGHHELLRVMVGTFEWIPFGQASISPELVTGVVGIIADMIVAGLRIGGPLIAILFLFQALMGVVARAVPQMGMFFNVAFVAAVALGLSLLGSTMPAWSDAAQVWQDDVLSRLAGAARGLGD